MTTPLWAGSDASLARFIEGLGKKCLAAYRENPVLVAEHANIERSRKQGGYGKRQIYELVQNGADALRLAPGRVEVRLTSHALYCANEGAPVDEGGVTAILNAYVSQKRGEEIGRFGLGFKSVLGVTSRPEFYSRSASFRFDPLESEDMIRHVVPGAERTPILRIAIPIDPEPVFQEDQTLAELAKWATTVVRLPFDAAPPEWLRDDLEDFPEEFLLFCQHVRRLILKSDEDEGFGTVREIKVERDGTRFTLHSGREPVVFRVKEVRHVPSEEARNDAGELADRQSVPLVWAVPMSGRQTEGRFWAFFPTEFRTTLRGTANAPWNLNDDRQNLLEDAFNRDLLDHLSGLVAQSLPDLVDPSDPGRYLELLPARGRETRNWADEFVTGAVYKKAAALPSLPDMNGVLRLATEVHLQPDGLPPTAVALWSECVARPSEWVHPSASVSDNRRSRAERLFATANRSVSTVAMWLEALVTSPSVESSTAAIRAAAEILRAAEAENRPRLDHQNARIVLTSRNTLVKPAAGAVFLPTVAGELPVSNVLTVHAELAADPLVEAALRRLGIGDVDASSELEATLASVQLTNLDNEGWDRIWRLVRVCPPDRAYQILDRKAGQDARVLLKVKTMAGVYRRILDVLLPGTVLPPTSGRDLSLTVDDGFHAVEESVLRRFGLTDRPTARGMDLREAWFPQYRRHAVEQFRNAAPIHLSALQDRLLEFDRTESAGPLTALFDATDESRVAFTEVLMNIAQDEATWTMRHRTQAQFPRTKVDSPPTWAIRVAGRFHTTLGTRPLGEIVGEGVSHFSQVLPVTKWGRPQAEWLGFPNSIQELSETHWEAAYLTCESAVTATAWGLYLSAVGCGAPSPMEVRCRTGWELGWLPPSQVVAVASHGPVSALVDLGEPFIETPDEVTARQLHNHWGMRSAEEIVQTELRSVQSGPEEAVTDRFPALSLVWDGNADALSLTPCVSLRRETVTRQGRSGDDLRAATDGSRMFYLETLSDSELLDEVCRSLDIRLLEEQADAILKQRDEARQHERFADVRALSNDADRLNRCIGEEALRRNLPKDLLAAAVARYGEVDGARVAVLTIAVFGAEALSEHKEALKSNKFDPPSNWAGGRAARQFVRALGFPPEYAGFESPKRDSEIIVDGPVDLGSLHEYQRQIIGRIRQLFRAPTPERGLLSLPTGAGKTRIAVEAFVEAIRAGELRGPILWIAQTDELCEQAVQSWNELWRAKGVKGSLVLNRLWSTNQVEEREDRPQVVVATDRKLDNVRSDPGYDWLRLATCVVIDEAHMAASAPTYTRILDWLGLGRGRDRCTLLGLTATAYKGSASETERLANRFGRNRLEHGVLGEEPYVKLQADGILAEVDHELLEGAQMRLEAGDLVDFSGRSWLSPAAERRLGADTARTDRLLNHILSQDADWRILVFATSVDHARTLAALLAAEGRPARAVSSDTSDGARRSAVEAFRDGRVKVLTNYGVLTTGFDAPMTRAIYVSRPTFSPVLYQQMIGRGLRGKLNRGTERCLIVNVSDTFDQFGEKLAFTEFEYLWSRPTASGT